MVAIRCSQNQINDKTNGIFGFPCEELMLPSSGIKADYVSEKNKFSPNLPTAKSIEYRFMPEFSREEIHFSVPVADSMIVPLSQMSTHIALLNFHFSSFYDENPSTPRTHSCSICHKHGLTKTAAKYVRDVLNGNTVNQPSTPQEAEILQMSISHIITTLKEKMHIREVEVFHAVIIFQQIFKMHWQCSTFILLRHCLPVVFLACVAIAHKFATDFNFQNGVLCRFFSIIPETLSEIERTVLCFLDFNLYSVELYNSVAASFGAETVLPHLSSSTSCSSPSSSTSSSVDSPPFSFSLDFGHNRDTPALSVFSPVDAEPLSVCVSGMSFPPPLIYHLPQPYSICTSSSSSPTIFSSDGPTPALSASSTPETEPIFHGVPTPTFSASSLLLPVSEHIPQVLTPANADSASSSAFASASASAVSSSPSPSPSQAADGTDASLALGVGWT